MSAPKSRGGRGAGSRVISDPRFAHAHTDPRFSRPRTAERSFTPDARFSSMFTDAAFGSESKVDKWGRAVQWKGGERLKKFYGIQHERGEVGEVGEEKENHTEEKEEDESKKMNQRKKKQQQGGQGDKPQPVQRAAEKVEEDGEEDSEERAVNSDEQVEEDDDDSYSHSYLSSRAVAPPSSDDENEEDDHEPASPTFPNVLGSDSDSDIEPLYSQTDADDAVDEQPAEDIQHGDATDTVALVNMDWDRLRAVDIYMLCRSFVADGDGRVVSVAVYRSKFGKERMAEEEKYGPIGLYGGSMAEYRERIDQKVREQMEEEAEKLEAADADNDQDDESKSVSVRPEADNENGHEAEDEEADEQSEEKLAAAARGSIGDVENEQPLDQELLRQYELSRLRYFYAIIRCSSVPAATSLYAALDASEFESSANKLDLRFVPADTEFDAEDVRDECGENDMDERAMTEYRAPAVFVTKSLQHSRVELTWDADDEERKRKLKAGGGGAAAKKGKGKKGVEVDEGEDDLRVYLASDDDDDGYGSDAVVEAEEADEEEDKPVLKKKARARYTALLSQLKRHQTDDGEAGDDGNDDDEEKVIEMTFEPGLKAKAEELVKRVTERDERKHETAFEKRAREVREKKKAHKKQQRDASRADDAAAMEAAEAEEDEVEVDMEDDFFKGAFDDDEYMPAEQQPVADRAKAFFADDERKERPDKRLNREERERRHRGTEENGVEEGERADADGDDRKRRAELELLLLPNQPGEDGEADGKQHYHLSQLVKANKRKSKPNKADTASTAADSNDSGEWHVDVSDPRFAAMYERADYSIDPTHPAYKPTAEMERVMAERQRRRLSEAKQREQTVKQRKAQTAAQQQAADGTAAGGGLDELVASVRAKTRARESEVEQRKRKDAEVRKAAVVGTAGSKRLGEQSLTANNKKQKLRGELRL